MISSCGPISTRGVRTQAVRGKVSVLCHTIAVASSLLWRLLLSTFVHLSSFFTFLDKKTLLCFLTADLCVLFVFLRQVLRRKSWLSK